VYSREIEGNILNLSASGWTYNNTFVLFDFETESMWYHLSNTDGLTCISGEYADKKLEEFNSTQTRWINWIVNNPNSKYLKYPQ
jgi:uncharacterized protein DUF3179